MARVWVYVHVHFQIILAAKLEDVLEGAQTYAELWLRLRDNEAPRPLEKVSSG